MINPLKSMACVAISLLACGPEGVSPEAPAEVDTPPWAGGMDGAGLNGLGLSYGEEGIVVQSLWQQQEPSYLIFNTRSAPIEVVVSDDRCAATCLAAAGCVDGGPWQVPPGSMRVFAGEEV